MDYQQNNYNIDGNDQQLQQSPSPYEGMDQGFIRIHYTTYLKHFKAH